MARSSTKTTPTADSLATCRAKRDFEKTAEPSGATKPTTGTGFLVQKHDATRLHYDFRLELDGVLLSYAVTRGPSLDPDDNRPRCSDRGSPTRLCELRGYDPQGPYGGGTVMLWDNGTWESIAGKDPRKTIPEAHLHFILHGRRMKGEWIMIRLKPRGKEKGENWLLRKVADEHSGGSDDLVATHLTGIESGLTMAEIAASKTAQRSPMPKAAAGISDAEAVWNRMIRAVDDE